MDSRMDPRKQFSKKLARWTSGFWFAYMTWLSVLILLAPSAALYAVYMGIIATAVMVLNVWAYTKNSIYEKGAFALLNKTKLELSLKGGNPKPASEPYETEEDEDFGEEGGEADG